MPNTITVIDGRVESRSNGQFIETILDFAGNFRVEVDVEKVGAQDHGCWDFMIAIAALGGNSGVIRFDFGGFDGIALGQPCLGNYYQIDSAGVNKGKAILTYSNPYLLFSFINDEGEVISAGAVYAGEFVTSKIRINLAAYSDSPRYVDNVKVYSLDGEGVWTRNPANNHLYRLIDGMTWMAAEAQAVEWGVHLVTINDPAEESWLQGQFGTAENFWIGFNDLDVEGDWQWTSGEAVTHTNWCAGEPNNYCGPNCPENAAVMSNPDCWNDIPEISTPRAILEYSEAGLATGSISGSVVDAITDEPVEDSSTGSIYLDMGWHKFVYRHHEGAEGQLARAAFKTPGDTEWRLFSTSESELDIRVSDPQIGPAASGIWLINKKYTCWNYSPRNHQQMVQCVDEEATEAPGWYGEGIVDAVDHD